MNLLSTKTLGCVNLFLVLFLFQAIPYASQDEDAFKKHIECVEDQEFLRAQLPTENLAAFVRDGAILPRVSGADDCPMDRNNVTLFKSPETMSVEFDLPHAGK